MIDLDQLLKENRIEAYFEYNFRGIACWSVTLFECLVNNGNDESEQKPKFIGQYCSYSDMCKAVLKYLKESINEK